MLLKDRVAIVTGGARGIGRGIADKFAQEGCSVAIVDVRMEEANRALAQLSKKGQKVLAVQCDVTDGRQVQGMIDEVIGKLGKVDIFVNNAGVAQTPGRSTPDISEEEWDKILATNLKSVFLCCRAIIPHMKERRYGKIVNISSLAAVYPPGETPAYCASKAGILGISNELAVELAPFNICVNTILPGMILTEIWDDVITPGPNRDGALADLSKRFVPMQRIGSPEDIAGVALFFSSDLSAYVTAAQIIVGGGMPLKFFD